MFNLIFRISILSLLFILSPNMALASQFYFSPLADEIGVGGEIEVSVILNPEDEQINAIEGEIIYPSDAVEVSDIRYGDSVVNIWIQSPSVLERDNKIIFSGIIPGGFSGIQEPFAPKTIDGKLFSLILKTKKEGDYLLSLTSGKALLNDGLGSSAEVSTRDFRLRVSSERGVSMNKSFTDDIPPESFSPEVTSDPNAFNGKYFLIFSTQDKNSGIDHYEVKEGWGKWVVVESPYILEDQELKSRIKVKAIDRAGNERLEKVFSSYPLFSYAKLALWVIIIIIVVRLIYFLRKRK